MCYWGGALTQRSGISRYDSQPVLWMASFPSYLAGHGNSRLTLCNHVNCRTQGWNALMTASTFGHADVVVTLLRHPHVAPLIDQRDRDGQTALFKACYGG